MTLAAGTVAYTASSGEHTGTGLSLALFVARKAVMVALNASLASLEASTTAQRAATLGWLAEDSEAIAIAVLAHIAANAVVTTTVSAGGLQRTPDPNDANTATAAPAAPVNLTGAIT